MKQNLIMDIVQGMLPYLNNAQTQRLQEVLQHTLFDYEVKKAEKDKKNKYVRCERSYGSYSRSFDLSGVKADEIKAKYENGVLKLTMPKKENTLPEARHLEIE